MVNKLHGHLKKVSVIGVGKTKYGVFKEKTLLDLAVEAG